jgi:hypothetical protein
MTRKEAIQWSLPIEVGDLMLEKACIDADFDMDLDYSKNDRKDVELIIAELCKILSASPDIAEGTLTITQAKAELNQIREDILKKYGFSEGGITTLSKW